MIVGAFVDGVLRGVGELVRVSAWPKSSAEIALSVEAPFQNDGIGTELLRRILNIARNRYIDRVCMLCLNDNIKMQKIARKFEADLTRAPGETEGRISPLWPSYLSIFEEAAGDSETFFNAVFRTDLIRPIPA